MNRFAKTANRIIGTVVNRFTSVTAQSTGDAAESFEISPAISALCREVGAEGIVLLKNEKNALPIKADETVSVFGRVQNDFFYVGYGSGGDVNAPYKIGFTEGLRSAGIKINEELASYYKDLCDKNPVDNGYWGHWPMSYDELEIGEDICENAAKKSSKAIVVIGRSSGEDRELKLEKGSYLLSDAEKVLLDRVTSAFDTVVLLLNCGSIMDMGEIDAYGDGIAAVMYIWQNGMESGNSTADVLSGKVSPSGKLTDTIAKSYADYPGSEQFGNKDENFYIEDIYVGYRYFETFAKDKVLYPFGFGLSYTGFAFENIEFSAGGKIDISLDVRNIGGCSGKETVQVYFEAPQGRLGKPARVLVTYKKTKTLAPGESERVQLDFPMSEMSSYDEEKSAYILEKGVYRIYTGSDVRSARACGEYKVDEDRTVRQLSQRGAPVKAFRRLVNENGKPAYRDVPLSKRDLKQDILSTIPKEIKPCNKDITFDDVKKGKATLDEFAGTLPLADLEALSRGDFTMNSPLGAPGNAGVFGGITPLLQKKGVPALTCTDGPSGIRLNATSSLLPIGVSLACTWNTQLIEALYEAVGREMAARGSDILLAPGMNIHRNPLCGRNFEYFSEDPVVTGKCGAAVVRGVQKYGFSACPKHFACNNQETNRTFADSVVSERALREIYLLGFEICVITSKPKNIMTSYNRINGVWGHYNYELVTAILRNEWDYSGSVMTDWWMRRAVSPEFPKVRDQAYRVRAGVNVLMPGGRRAGYYRKRPDGTLLKNAGRPGGITLAEIQANAKEVLSIALSKK
ncbi:MAG: glycoside hydrolase family 3 protein [Clostridia bacterium]|nr:glycoside hydrolase family 3 protein [Clostridia bacterium]